MMWENFVTQAESTSYNAMFNFETLTKQFNPQKFYEGNYF